MCVNYFHIPRIVTPAFLSFCRPLSTGCFRTCSKRIGSFICSARASSIAFETIYAIFIFLLNVALTSPAQDINDYVLNSHVSRDTLTDLSREAVEPLEKGLWLFHLHNKAEFKALHRIRCHNAQLGVALRCVDLSQDRLRHPQR